MLLLVFSLVIMSFLVYIIFVAFSDAATLLQTSNNGGVMSPLSNITRSPHEWLARYIPMGSPTEEVKQHQWLSQFPHTTHTGYPTSKRTTAPRNLF